MRILHTADLHFSESDSNTLEAIDEVLEAAADHSVDMVTIGGDMFDSPTDATRLKTAIRERFTGNDFDIVAIPGNHDADILDHGFDLGPDFDVIHEAPLEVQSFGDVALVGVPYHEALTSELFTAMQDAAPDAGVRLLLIHCTLDIGFQTTAAGETEQRRYFPIDPGTLGELEYDIVLAGHIHSRFREEPLPNGGTFLYPGSPTSHSTAETGPRYAALVDTETQAIDRVPLATFYHDSFERRATPANQDAVVDELDEWTTARADDDCEVEIIISGYVDADEQRYGERLRTAAAPFEMTNTVESISHVLESDLYQRVADQLDDETVAEYEAATVEGAEELVRNALATLIDTGEIRR